MSVRSRTGVLGKGTPRVPPVAAGGGVVTSDYLLRTEFLHGAGTFWDAEETFVGGSYFLERPVIFNHVVVSLAARTLPFSGRIAIYQHPHGEIAVDAPLVAEATFSDIGGNRQVIPLVGGTTATLSTGVLWVLWGRSSAGGAFQFFTYNVLPTPLITTQNAFGEHPVTFTTTVPATSAPATFDPFQGGASGVNQDADSAAIVRVKLL